MLDVLRFVQGAVAKKDFVPEMTHFNISDGFITSHNGTIALCSPIPLNLNVRPKADQMLRAIRACDGDRIVMHMTPSGKLSVKSGAFKTMVDCLPLVGGFVPVPTAAPKWILPKSGFVGMLKKLLPFISEDASRPWSRGILFTDRGAYATNNIVIVKHLIGAEDIFPGTINLGKAAIVEMIRIGEEPIHTTIDNISITFYYEGDRWLRANTLSLDWPDIDRVFSSSAILYEIDPRLWNRVEKLVPFVGELGKIFIQGEEINTGPDGTTIDGMWSGNTINPKPALFNIEHFRKLAGVATHFETSSYPAPCQFSGENLVGVIAGLRDA